MNRFFVPPKNIGDKCLIIDKKDDVNPSFEGWRRYRSSRRNEMGIHC